MNIEVIIQNVFEATLKATHDFGALAGVPDDHVAVEQINAELSSVFTRAYASLKAQGFDHLAIMQILQQTGERGRCEYQLMHMDKADMVDAAFAIMGVRYRK